MNAPTVCDTCPHNQPSALAVLFSDDMIIQERIATFIDTKETTEEKVNALLICMTMMVFGKDNKKISRNTDWVVHQCLDAIWKLGNVGWSCDDHHIAQIYERAGRGKLCLRKYMMEETVKFLQGLWQESDRNEEQFQALLLDRWTIHQMAFTS